MEQGQTQQPQIMEYLSELVRSQLEYRKPAPLPDDISLEMLEDIAKRGHMAYLILGALLKLELPEDRQQRFRTYVIHSTLKTLAQVCGAKTLQKRFEEAGIRNQVLKGTVLKQIYPSPEMREMSDVDIMLYEQSFDKAEKILEELGYTKIQAIKHHVIFKKEPYLVLEAHWSLYDQNVDKEQFLYYKDHFRAVLSPDCEYTYEFPKEDFYVYMISHMAKHFYENGCGIRNLIDVHIYLKNYAAVMDQAKIKEELEKLGLVAFEEHMRKLAEIWLEQKPSTEFYNHLFEYMLDCGIYGKGENGVWGQYAKDTEKGNVSMKRWYYFPGLDYMKEYYPWLEKHPWLLPVAWGLRGIHGIMSKEKREKKQMVFTVEQEKAETIQGIYRTLQLNFKK